MDDIANWQIFNPTTGVWALVAMVGVALFKVWPLILERLNERHRDTAAERAGDWTRLRDEISRLSEAEKQCRKDYADLHRQFMGLSVEVANLRGEVAAREGYQIGRGDAAQEVTILESTKRMDRENE